MVPLLGGWCWSRSGGGDGGLQCVGEGSLLGQDQGAGFEGCGGVVCGEGLGFADAEVWFLLIWRVLALAVLVASDGGKVVYLEVFLLVFALFGAGAHCCYGLLWVVVVVVVVVVVGCGLWLWFRG